MRNSNLVFLVNKHLVVSVVILFSLGISAMSQPLLSDSVPCKEKDISEILFKKKRAKQKSDKNSFMMIVPAIGSNPSMGFFFGGVMQLAFKPKGSERLSMLSTGIVFSTTGQTNFNGKSNLYLFNDKLFVSADFRLARSSESTYGLGIDPKRGFSGEGGLGVNGYETNSVDSAQPLTFSNVRFNGTASYEVKDNLFFGVGLNIDQYSKIDDISLDIPNLVLTEHFKYSTREGFNPKTYKVNGWSLNAVYDTRDNLANAYKGVFANINWRWNPEWMGSDKNSSLLYYEFRAFHSLSEKRKRHLLGFWLLGQHLTSGTLPYLNLPAVGYDQRNRSGRAYTFGRFRGEDLFYTEGEYRFPISKCSGILGGVLFLNTTSTSDRFKGTNLFQHFQWAYGTGLRILLDKKTRTNLTIEAAFGRKSSGFYINATETF